MGETFIIAEAGANHNRIFEQATTLIDVAIEADADAVKFQTYSSETLYSRYTPDFAGETNIPSMIKSIEMPREWQKDLKSYCDDNAIEFMSTPFDEKAVDELFALGVKRLKIAGFESTDPRFVKYVASTKLPIVISAGIGNDVSQVNRLVTWIKEVNPSVDLTILHCNNAYPTPYHDINLGQIEVLIDIANVNNEATFRVGLQDHTRGILIPPVAVAMGAKCVEKHFTISRRLPGPDHPFAIEPDELSEMVQNIRIIETAISKKKDECSDSEKLFSLGRRAVIAKLSIKKGEKLTEDNITTKRPLLENSIAAIDYYDILGKTIIRDIKEDEILMQSDINP